MKFKILLFLLLPVLQVSAQKTNGYFQYGLYPYSVSKDYYYNQRIQPIDSDHCYLMLEDDRTKASINCSLDSIVIGGFGKPSNKGFKQKSKSSRDLIICYLSKDSIKWSLCMSPSNYNSLIGNRYTTNTLSIGNDILVLTFFAGDSMNFIDHLGTKKSINLPDTIGYALFRITKDANIILENYFPQGRDLLNARLLWANDKKYAILFPYSSPPTYPIIPKTSQLPDSQLTAIVIQYEFGNKMLKNWISGSLPIAIFQNGIHNISLNNQVLLGGTYDVPTKTIYKFPFSPAYKINNNPITYLSKPANYNRNKGYIFWMKLDMENWTVEDFNFALHDNKKTPLIRDFGILRDGYWFLGNFDSVAHNSNNSTWQKCNSNLKNSHEYSLFTFNTATKSINTFGFPEGTYAAYSDGDSLIFVNGYNSPYYPSSESADMDKSPDFKYPLLVGKYAGEFRLDGSLVWARNDNLHQITTAHSSFSAANGVRFIGTGTATTRNDLDFGFRFLGKVNVGDAGGTVTQLSKAPICDFDIELITYNHVTINYKGALNANFYFKYGDGSKDSNYNQRYFIHSYKKTGTFLLYCIAKNDFGRDTAYYEIDIYDIVSTTKLNKNNDIKLFPNPTENTLSWEAEATTHVDIFDANAKFIERIQTTQNSINIAHLPAGLYMVSVHTKNGSFINKIIKQ